jgi:glycosyltransferase involved in cell wall biosynthesis
MKAIKVTHITNVEVDNYFLNNLCDYTSREKVEFSAVTFAPAAGFVEGMKKRGVPVYALDAPDRKQYPRAIGEIWKILKKENPDIVHLHLFDPTLIGLILSGLQKRKTVLTRHHSDALYKISGKLKRAFYLRLERFVNARVDHIVAPSQMVRDILADKENVSPAKLSVIPYGQTTERFDRLDKAKIEKVRAELGIEDATLTLVCNSRLYHQKGHEYLFEALAPLIKSNLKVKLFLVGKGDFQPKLEELTEKHRIKDHVRFLGWRDDALEIMANADIIVHPSLEDALSSAVIESLMLERPIIATDISGVRDSLDNGKYGVIIPPADSGALRRALEEILANFEEYRRRAKKGRNYIIEYMSAEKVAKQYEEIYRRVFGQAS